MSPELCVYIICCFFCLCHVRWSIINCPVPEAPQRPPRGTPGKKPTTKPPRLSHMKDDEEMESEDEERDGWFHCVVCISGSYMY